MGRLRPHFRCPARTLSLHVRSTDVKPDPHYAINGVTVASTVLTSTWASLSASAEPWHGLLVGNGGSIALHSGFSYDSLFAAAVAANRLPTTQPLFSALSGGTTNFEYVLLALSHATEVGAALRTPTHAVTRAYDEVRNALIDTVNAVHCSHTNVQADLVRIAEFSKGFKTIVTLNYDLIFYWAMLAGNRLYGTWFKDAFVGPGQSFDPAWTRLRTPYNATGTSLVFFGHGSLILGTSLSGNESKIVTGGSPNLFAAIASQWQNGGLAPLFVSEGTSSQKLQAIRRSPYLSTVHHQVLTSFLDQNVVAYGLSFNENDDHVLSALSQAPPAKLAVSVHQPGSTTAQEFCHHVLARTASCLPSTTVDFFDASSPGCWNNP